MVALQQNYEQSSQCRHWRFSRAKLHEIRRATNQSGIERARANIAAEKDELHQQQTQPAPDSQDDTAVNYLTLEDELALCHFYETRIETVSKYFKFPNQVKATAVVFMKRFFLYNTVMDYPPKFIMLTCLYLATKTENHFIQIEEFAKPSTLKTTPKDILDYEFIVSQSLKFEFTIHHPYSPLYGFFLDAQAVVDNMALLTQVYNKAMEWCHKSLFTDLVFLYFPSQVALAAMLLAAQDVGWDFDTYLTYKFTEPVPRQELVTILTDIAAILKAYQPITVTTVRDIDRKLIYCRNPEKDPSSLLYQKKLQQAEDAEDQRRLAKVPAKPPSTESESVAEGEGGLVD
ncbi:hypothetical protein H4R34_004455 [Dimargaris verticillata]|uniref:Cyclin-like domain-containing protein n=1 Tax=Dimargaris verticillata TaxID=2761393 RepID=A0A9W8AYW6_9FUNG|nr:hypothetical protein H4R34_004455 [Dimargaris verticillata]